jgi:hypothetical protein
MREFERKKSGGKVQKNLLTPALFSENAIGTNALPIQCRSEKD